MFLTLVRGVIAILIFVVALYTSHYRAHSAPDSSMKRPLLEAAKQGDAETVNVLMKTGVDVNAQDEEGSTALTYAAERDYTEIVNTLIAAGADVNAQTKAGNNAAEEGF
jgi:ankyrin repeat protein